MRRTRDRRRPRAGRIALAATGAVALALAGAGAAGATEPAWLPPVDVSTGSADASDVVVTMNAAGEAVTAWDMGFGSLHLVQSAIRMGGELTQPADLSAPDDLSVPDPRQPRPQVAIDAAGNAIALWVRNSAPRFEYARRPAGAAFGPATDARSVGDLAPVEDALLPRIAMTPDGHGLATWTIGTGPFAIRYSDVQPDEPLWLRTLPTPGDYVFAPAVALAADGEAAIAWYRQQPMPSALYEIDVAVRPPGGEFGRPVTLSDADPFGDAPQVAIDAAGNAIVVWRQFDGGGRVVQAAVRPADGEFGRPVTLSAPGENTTAPSLATDATGRTTVVWSGRDAPGDVVWATTLAPDGQFGRAVTLSDPAGGADAPHVASAGGAATVVWTQVVDGERRVEAAVRPAGGEFGSAVALSLPGGAAEAPRVAMRAAGDALAVWRRYDGSRWVAQAAAYDATPPQIDDVEIPPTGVAGDPLPLSVAPSDVSSRVTTQWSFGDGATATGAAHTHVYAAPGVYEVRVTTTDALGNAAVASRQVAVAPSAPPLPAGPVVSGLTVTPAAFRAASRGPSAVPSAARGPRTGARVRLHASVAATVRLRVERRAAGRRVGGRCVRATRRIRRAPACMRWTTVPGSFAHSATAGRSGFTFSGRVGGRRLAPARYRLLATPRAAGLRGATVSTPFRILAPAPAGGPRR